MKIAIFFNKAGVLEGYEDVVSAHIQLPIKTTELLKGHNNNVMLIIPKLHKGYVLPSIFQKIKSDNIFYVVDSSKQSDVSAMIHGHKHGISLKKQLIQLSEIRGLLRKHKIEIFHVFGSYKLFTVLLLLKIFTPKIKFIWTCEIFNGFNNLAKLIISMFSFKIFVSTKYVNSALSKYFNNVEILRRGLVREFKVNRLMEKDRNRVLFWRDPSHENGADICFDIFQKLSLEYPDVLFTFAVRPHWNSLLKGKNFNGNIEFYEFPYPDGITIEKLLRESICVVLPFRELSVNPQLAVLETMQVGIPVISSCIESNKEILTDSGLGCIDSEANDPYLEKIKLLLDAPDIASDLGMKASEYIERDWNWNAYVKKLESFYAS